MIPPIDWRLATRIAGGIGGTQQLPDLAFDLSATAVACAEQVKEYTQLAVNAELPSPELVDRRGWALANLASMRHLLAAAGEEKSVGENLGPFASPVRAAVSGIVGAEIGALVGYLSQRVLGQYDLALLDPSMQPRLLYVAPNIVAAGGQMAVDCDQLWQWVVLHELTHAVQFAGVPWLRGYLGGLVTEALELAENSRRDLGGLSGLLVNAERRAQLLRKVQEDGLLVAFASPAQLDLLDRIQAVMALVEGHAEHVMDATGAKLLSDLPALRAALERRRASASPLTQLFNKLLGMELKLRQYKQGKQFCDAIVKRGGVELLNRAWSAPELVPRVAELTDPGAWVQRIS